MLNLDTILVAPSISLILGIKVIIIGHQVGLCHYFDFQVFLVLFFFLSLKLKSSEMVLVVFVILELLILAKDSTIFTKNILFKIFLLFNSLYFTYRHVNFLVDNHMEFLLLIRNIASQKNV